MDYFRTPLQAGRYFHIFNCANGDEKLFRESENYKFFLNKYSHHINPIAETFAYCLMPNHFHFIVRFKELELINKHFQSPYTITKLNIENTSLILSKQFSNLFSSYTQALNKKYHRRGNLFKTPFGRIEITNENYLRRAICYVHLNPVKHKIVNSIEDWEFTSFKTYYSNEQSNINRDEVIQLFNDLENMKFVHLNSYDNYGIEEKSVNYTFSFSSNKVILG